MFVSSFWRLGPQTPTERLLFLRPPSCPLIKFLATPLSHYDSQDLASIAASRVKNRNIQLNETQGKGIQMLRVCVHCFVCNCSLCFIMVWMCVHAFYVFFYLIKVFIGCILCKINCNLRRLE